MEGGHSSAGGGEHCARSESGFRWRHRQSERRARSLCDRFAVPDISRARYQPCPIPVVIVAGWGWRRRFGRIGVGQLTG